jgi:hypothetical protein
MIAEIIRGRATSLATMIGALALLAGSASGCSLAFVEGPPRDHASRHYFDCTSSFLAPTGDAVVGGLMLIGMLSDGASAQESNGVVEGTIAVTAALASATYGYVQATRCRDAKGALAERLLEPPYLPFRPAAAASGAPGTLSAPYIPQAAGGAPPGVPRRDPWLSEGPPPPPTWPPAAMAPPAAPSPPPPPAPVAPLPAPVAPLPAPVAPLPAPMLPPPDAARPQP